MQVFYEKGDSKTQLNKIPYFQNIYSSYYHKCFKQTPSFPLFFSLFIASYEEALKSKKKNFSQNSIKLFIFFVWLQLFVTTVRYGGLRWKYFFVIYILKKKSQNNKSLWGSVYIMRLDAIYRRFLYMQSEQEEDQKEW